MTEFTQDWTTMHNAVWTKHLSRFKSKPRIHALEVGTFEGSTARWFIDNILTGEDCSITCIDTFKGSPEHQNMDCLSNIEAVFDSNVLNASKDVRVLKIVGESAKHLRQLPYSHYNFGYIDGSHATKDVLTDLILSWPLFKVGGLVVIDDYLYSLDTIPYDKSVRYAVNIFMEMFQEEFILVHRGYQLILKKLK